MLSQTVDKRLSKEAVDARVSCFYLCAIWVWVGRQGGPRVGERERTMSIDTPFGRFIQVYNVFWEVARCKRIIGFLVLVLSERGPAGADRFLMMVVLMYPQGFIVCFLPVLCKERLVA